MTPKEIDQALGGSTKLNDTVNSIHPDITSGIATSATPQDVTPQISSTRMTPSEIDNALGGSTKLNSRNSGPSFGENLFKGIGSDLSRIGNTVLQPIDQLTGARPEGYNNYFGDTSGYGMRQGDTAGQRAKDIAGGILTTGSYALGGEALKGISLGGKVTTGALEGAVVGGMGGAGNELQNKDSTFGSVAESTALGAGGGALIGGGLASVGKGYNSLFNKDKVIQDIQNDWRKPTEIPKASYNNATNIYNDALAQGHDISDTLVKNKISVDSVRNGNVFDTADMADKLHQDTGYIAKDIMRPALEVADYTTPKTPLAEVRQSAIESVLQDNKIPDKEGVIAKIEKRFDSTSKGSLQEQYPNGFSLADLQDQKLTHTSGVNFANPDKDANYHISNAFRSSLEDHAPADLNIKKFNAELQKNYQAENYLRALNNKTIPQSLKRRLAIQLGKVAGAGIGDRVGGLIGGLGGYHAGGTLVSILENLPNPLKENALRILKVEKPEVFKAFEKYLADKAEFQKTSIKLPAGEKPKLGTSENPIIVGGDSTPQKFSQKATYPQQNFPPLPVRENSIPMGGTTKEGYSVNQAGEKTPIQGKVGVFEAQKNPVTQNPQSGKFQTSYNSQSRPVNLDQSGSVATPSSNINKNPNISSTIPQFNKDGYRPVQKGEVLPAGYKTKMNITTGDQWTNAPMKQPKTSGLSSIPNKEGGFVAQSVPLKSESPLIQEARKYKSAEEFVKAQTDSDYKMSHRPTEGVRAFDLTEKVDGENMIPKDMYSQWYGSRGTKSDLESIDILKKIKGNPNADVTIYRASPKESFNNGDWVSLSKTYAKEHAEGNNTKVYSKVVKAKDLKWAMDDVNEFGYYPENYKSQLTDIWNKAQQSKGSVKINPLLGIAGATAVGTYGASKLNKK